MYGWETILPQNINDIPANLFNWITKVNHLKLGLIQQGFKPELILIGQQHRVLPDEEAALIQTHQGLIRQTYFFGNKQLLTYGRTVVPEKTYRAFEHEFETLGIRSIGETLLHNKANVIRGAFEFGFVAAGTELFQLATKKYDKLVDGLWGRRSLFFISGYPLCIIELFFPDLPPYEIKNDG